MNRALWKPALLTATLLVVATASGFLLRGNTAPDKSPEASKTDEKTSETAQTPKAGETLTAGDPAKAGPNPETADERRRLLETVGALTAAHCYQSYFNIGFIADAKAKGTYTNKDAFKVLDSVLSLLDSVDRTLATLGKIDLDKEDRESLEQMRRLSALLRQQGKQLESFWNSGKEEDAAKYESVRKDAWAAISRLTGLRR